jgi:hypothetical protein
MSRKKSSETGAELDRADDARWRYLVRNPGFRHELKTLNRLWFNPGPAGPPGFHAEREAAVARWNLRDIPIELIERFSFLMAREGYAGLERHRFVDGRIELGSAVFTPIVDFRDFTDASRRFLNIRIDTENPIEALVAAFEATARELLAPAKKKRRLDKTDFYLQVFDLAESGTTFRSIAAKLASKPSTVKSAYLRASRNIFGPERGPSKKSAPHNDIDSATHVAKCPECGKAQKVEELCAKARGWANQDYKSQREATGYDTVRG